MDPIEVLGEFRDFPEDQISGVIFEDVAGNTAAVTVIDGAIGRLVSIGVENAPTLLTIPQARALRNHLDSFFDSGSLEIIGNTQVVDPSEGFETEEE